jgi:hypothetical protein
MSAIPTGHLKLPILNRKKRVVLSRDHMLIIAVVPRVKLAYDKKVYDIIHPERRNLTAIRGYKRLGGLPDDPHTDPQDRSWYGPHDRLFVEAETVEMDFHTGPEYGMSLALDRRLCEEIRSEKG